MRTICVHEPSRHRKSTIAEAFREEYGSRWEEESPEAIEATDRYVAEYGLPLAKYPLF
jgi:post-segregation antitoxin (ccd killing protein)